MKKKDWLCYAFLLSLWPEMILKSYEAAIERSCTKVLFSKYRKEACSLIGNEHLQGYFSRILTKSLFHLHCETAISITPNFEGHLSLVAPDTFEHALLNLFCVNQKQPVLYFLHQKRCNVAQGLFKNVFCYWNELLWRFIICEFCVTFYRD